MTAAAVDEDLTADALYADDDDEFTSAPPEEPGEPAAPQVDLGPDEQAPYGYTLDRRTGEKRAKKTAGRPRAPRTAEELAAEPEVPPEPDKPPEQPKQRLFARAAAAPVLPPEEPGDVPMPKGGAIAKGVNKLYRRAGKLVRVWNYELGMAFIECTKPDPEDEDDVTVGQAWENLARDNPRIRAWLVNLIKGGDWQDLVMSHAPIGVAIVTSTWVGRVLPLGRLAESFLEPDDDELEPGDEGQPPAERLRPEDARAMMEAMEANAHKIAGRMGVKVPPHVARQAMRQAEQHAARMGVLTPPYSQHDLPPDDDELIHGGPAANGTPAAYRRRQPKRQSRSQRRH